MTPSLLLCGRHRALPAPLAMTSPPLGTMAASPRKELKNFSVPLQLVREPGFPGRSNAFLSPLALTSLEKQWMWLPGSTWDDALGSACSASPAPSTTESLGRAPSGSFIRC